MTSFILRHKLLVVLAWLLLSALGIWTLPHLGGRLDYSYTTPGQPGFEANLKIRDKFTIDAAFEAHLPILRLPPGQGMDTQAGRDEAARTFDAAAKAGPVAIADYATTHDPKFILDHGAATWALINQPNPDKGPGAGMEARLPPVLQASVPPGAKLTITGFSEMLSNAGPNGQNLLTALMLAAGLAFVLLVIFYGSAIAVLPILASIPAICVTVLCVYALTWVAPVTYFIEYMITLLSLGIAIDFSLVVVIRWREERARGAGREEAVIAAGAHAGKAVLLSGLTTSAGLLSLAVLPVPFLRSLGYGSMLIPFVAVAVAVTLLPVALATVGPGLDRYCFWPMTATTYSKGWQRWTTTILRHRWAAAIVAVAILATLSAPALAINTAEPLIESLSHQGPAADAFRELRASGVPSAVDFPIWVITHGGEKGLQQATSLLSRAPGVYDVMSPSTPAFRNGQDSLILVIPTNEGSTDAGKATVADLRHLVAPVSGGAEVGGSTAADLSFTNAVYGNFPRLLATVGGLTFLILAFYLRSIALALKAVVLNVISLGVAFGFMVVFWQHGFGSMLVYGMSATGAIRDWIPAVIFASLFGLSMDYEVFLLARFREEYDRSGSTDDAIIQGLARTGRLVTCAALILMVTFLSLSIDPNQIVKIMATTLAVGVLVDAIIIRTLLFPALVSLMGRWNWWFPAALSRPT